MDATLTVNLSELRGFANTLFDALSARGVLRVAVERPHYWDIYFEQAFALESNPEPIVGDVRDDFEDLRKEASGLADDVSDPAIPLWHAFHHLSGLMKFMAESDLSGRLRGADNSGPGRV